MNKKKGLVINSEKERVCCVILCGILQFTEQVRQLLGIDHMILFAFLKFRLFLHLYCIKR